MHQQYDYVDLGELEFDARGSGVPTYVGKISARP